MNHSIEVKNLHVSIDGQAILKGFNLTVPKGEVHANGPQWHRQEHAR